MHFLQVRYPQAPQELKNAFERLLELPDPELFALLMGKGTASDRQIENVVESILTESQHLS